MKIPILTGFLVFLVTCVFAAPPAPDLKVERRTLDREEPLKKGKRKREELIRGLHITVRNNGAKGMAEGEVEWSIVVEKNGKDSAVISSGKEKLKALNALQATDFTVGAISVIEEGSRGESMEYRVIVRQGGAETAKMQSSANFDALAKDARSLDEEPKKKKK